MDICMKRGKEGREQSYGCWGASLFLSAAWKRFMSRGMLLGSIICLSCPSAWIRPITVKAPTWRHTTECPYLPMHLQEVTGTYICVPSLFRKRKNKPFKKCPVVQDKISSLFFAFHLTVPQRNLFLFFSSISFLPQLDTEAQFRIVFAVCFVFFLSLTLNFEIDDLLCPYFCLLNTEMIKI